MYWSNYLVSCWNVDFWTFNDKACGLNRCGVTCGVCLFPCSSATLFSELNANVILVCLVPLPILLCLNIHPMLVQGVRLNSFQHRLCPKNHSNFFSFIRSVCPVSLSVFLYLFLSLLFSDIGWSSAHLRCCVRTHHPPHHHVTMRHWPRTGPTECSW